jgi:flagellar basal-body rod protein FlgB
LFEIASQRTQWLNTRQSLIASNVANANTPAFQARDLPPFASVLDRAGVSMVTTDPAHISPSDAAFDPGRPADDDGANATLSGNSVDLESEMIKLGEIGRDNAMTNSIKKIFHQMMLSALK